MNIKYALYWNTGSAEGGVEGVNMDDIWSSENPDGWTYQHIGGIFDNFQGLYDSWKEAKATLDEYYEAAEGGE